MNDWEPQYPDAGCLDRCSNCDTDIPGHMISVIAPVGSSDFSCDRCGRFINKGETLGHINELEST